MIDFLLLKVKSCRLYDRKSSVLSHKAFRKRVESRAENAVPFVGVDLRGYMGGKHIRTKMER